MTRNSLVFLNKSSSPLDYPIQTLLVSFISLCTFVEACLVLSLETLTLTDIDHVSIIKSSVQSPYKKEVESPTKVNQNMLAYVGN